MNRDHIISRQPSKVVRWGLDCHLRRLAASCPPADVAPPCFPAPIIFFLFHPRTFVSILFIFGLIGFFFFFFFLLSFFFSFLSFLSPKYSESCCWSIRVISSLISSPRAHRGSRNKTQDTCVARVDTMDNANLLVWMIPSSQRSTSPFHPPFPAPYPPSPASFKSS